MPSKNLSFRDPSIGVADACTSFDSRASRRRPTMLFIEEERTRSGNTREMRDQTGPLRVRGCGVGCFDGSFLDDPIFPTEGRFGIEVQPRAAGLARSRGITIVGTDFDDLRSLDSTYDAVVAFDVIEHVHD